MSSEVGLLKQTTRGTNPLGLFSGPANRDSSQDSKPSVFAEKFQQRHSAEPKDTTTPQAADQQSNEIQRPQPRADTARHEKPSSRDSELELSADDADRTADGEQSLVPSVTTHIASAEPTGRPLRFAIKTDATPAPATDQSVLKAPVGLVAQYTTTQHTTPPEGTTEDALESPTEIEEIASAELTALFDANQESDGVDTESFEPADSSAVDTNEITNSHVSEPGETFAGQQQNTNDEAPSQSKGDATGPEKNAVTIQSDAVQSSETTHVVEQSVSVASTSDQPDLGGSKSRRKLNESVGTSTEAVSETLGTQDSTGPGPEQAIDSAEEAHSSKPQNGRATEAVTVQSDLSQPNSFQANGSQPIDSQSGNGGRGNVQLAASTISETQANEPESSRSDVKPVEATTSTSETAPQVTNRTTLSPSGETAKTDGDTTPRLQTLVDRVAEAVESAGRQQSSRPLRIRIDPPELGVLSIEVHTQGGQVSAKMQVESSAAQRLLLDHLPQLQEALSQQTGSSTQVEIQRSESSNSDSQQQSFAQDQATSQQQRQHQDQRRAAASVRNLSDGIETPDEKPTSEPALSPDRTHSLVGIDIEV
ncbi:flagellar hook-length control protein FliK [Thalassoroseus pseudoceratinae]|uniref:flagellar hook-length control protein FliK n=1 Tax=Thalassoroseus pseudoceratinae TaxID=2713176 RepID=UPI001422D558|nr:flagellar hook-length control protein FliK [Thalassoroseus pseudoceratinae]